MLVLIKVSRNVVDAAFWNSEKGERRERNRSHVREITSFIAGATLYLLPGS